VSRAAPTLATRCPQRLVEAKNVPPQQRRCSPTSSFASRFHVSGTVFQSENNAYPVRAATNTGDWRFDHCSRAHWQATGGPLVWHEDGFSIFGFKTADQAAAFQRWAETCGIDWTVEPRARPLPHPRSRPSGRLPMDPVRPDVDAIGASAALAE
jgi:hypothetical protein